MVIIVVDIYIYVYIYIYIYIWGGGRGWHFDDPKPELGPRSMARVNSISGPGGLKRCPAIATLHFGAKAHEDFLQQNDATRQCVQFVRMPC